MQEYLTLLMRDAEARGKLLAALPALETWPWPRRSLFCEDLLLENGPWALDLLERSRPDDEWLLRLLERLAQSEGVRGGGEDADSTAPRTAVEVLDRLERLAHEPNPIRAAARPDADSLTLHSPLDGPTPGGGEEPSPRERAPQEWTVLVYSNQFDSDLFSFFDFKMAEASVDPARVNVVYRMRRVDGSRVADEFKRHHWVTWADGNWSGLRTYLVQPSQAPYYAAGSPVLLEEPDADLDDTGRLKEFIEWGVRRFPARRYCLSLWNHGSHVKGPSLLEGCELAVSVDKLGRDVRDGWRAAAGSGRKLDLLVLNGCNLASLELLYELSEMTELAFATQTRNPVPGDGFLYGLLSRPEPLSSRDTLLAYFEDFVGRARHAYRRNGIDTALAASAIDQQRLRNLAGSMGDLVRALLDEPGPGDAELGSMLPSEDPEFSGFEFDVTDLMGRLGARAGRVGERARAVLELLETPSRSPVLAHHHNQRVSHLRGLNVYVKTPATLATLDRIWREVKRQGWDDAARARLSAEFAAHPYHQTLFAREIGWGRVLLRLLSPT